MPLVFTAALSSRCSLPQYCCNHLLMSQLTPCQPSQGMLKPHAVQTFHCAWCHCCCQLKVHLRGTACPVDDAICTPAGLLSCCTQAPNLHFAVYQHMLHRLQSLCLGQKKLSDNTISDSWADSWTQDIHVAVAICLR